MKKEEYKEHTVITCLIKKHTKINEIIINQDIIVVRLS